MKLIDKNYEPKDFEQRIYDNWIAKRYFEADNQSDKTPFTIMMPPPNITGQLHMGHALDNTLQDIFIRYKRMAGYCALWVPGTDHASIATEAKIVEAMANAVIESKQGESMTVKVDEFNNEMTSDEEVAAVDEA